MDELISVIVPVYNVEKYLNRCVDSIINQTYKNLEIILVDDGSPDNCGRICDEYAKKDSRIKVIHKENSGVSSARNKGIDIAKGKWISFIDSDDWIEEDYFKLMLSSAKENDADIVLCGYKRIWKNNIEEIKIRNKKDFLNSKEYLIQVLNPQTGFGFCHMKLIDKKCINKIRMNENLIVAEDAMFNIQIAEKINKAVLVNKALYNYRFNENSVVKKYNNNYASNYLESMKKIKEYIIENYNDDEILQNYYNCVAFHVMLIAVNFCYHPNNKSNNKKQLLKEICQINEFNEGIEKSNFNNLSLTRKITLFTIKNKMFFLTELICKIRQIQNNNK